MIFHQSASWYNALYRHKDYGAEAAYVSSLVTRHREGTESFLDLGCGTGMHARHFYSLGYRVHGVDRSEEMLSQAREGEVPGELEYSPGDIRSLALGREFHAATALFHVMSYMETNEDLTGVLDAVSAHLVEDGIFVFDFWYGPAVLSDLPEVRVKRVDEGGSELIRVAEPRLLANENVVSIDYSYFVKEPGGALYRRFTETHRMRYLFLPEIDLLLENTGFVRKGAYGWMTGDAPGMDSWYACVVAGKRPPGKSGP